MHFGADILTEKLTRLRAIDTFYLDGRRNVRFWRGSYIRSNRAKIRRSIFKLPNYMAARQHTCIELHLSHEEQSARNYCYKKKKKFSCLFRCIARFLVLKVLVRNPFAFIEFNFISVHFNAQHGKSARQKKRALSPHSERARMSVGCNVRDYPSMRTLSRIWRFNRVAGNLIRPLESPPPSGCSASNETAAVRSWEASSISPFFSRGFFLRSLKPTYLARWNKIKAVPERRRPPRARFENQETTGGAHAHDALRVLFSWTREIAKRDTTCCELFRSNFNCDRRRSSQTVATAGHFYALAIADFI